MKLSRKKLAKTIARNVYERNAETNYVYSAFISDKLVGMHELLMGNGIEMTYDEKYDIISVTFREGDKVCKYEFTIEEVQ